MTISKFLVKETPQKTKEVGLQNNSWLTIFPGIIRKTRKYRIHDFDMEKHFLLIG